MEALYPVVRDQTVFLVEQIAEFDNGLARQQGMVSKYKALNQEKKRIE